jgi:hypothetical protein
VMSDSLSHHWHGMHAPTGTYIARINARGSRYATSFDAKFTLVPNTWGTRHPAVHPGPSLPHALRYTPVSTPMQHTLQYTSAPHPCSTPLQYTMPQALQYTPAVHLCGTTCSTAPTVHPAPSLAAHPCSTPLSAPHPYSTPCPKPCRTPLQYTSAAHPAVPTLQYTLPQALQYTPAVHLCGTPCSTTSAVQCSGD